MLASELDVISMEDLMNKMKKKLLKKILLWLAVIAVLITAGTVYGVLPAISLHSPTSFPVDI